MAAKGFKKIQPGADLSSANLIHANLIRANLAGADLRGADLTGVKFPKGYGKLPVEEKELSTTKLRGGQLPKEDE